MVGKTIAIACTALAILCWIILKLTYDPWEETLDSWLDEHIIFTYRHILAIAFVLSVAYCIGYVLYRIWLLL